MKRKTIFRWLKIIIILYSAIGIALYYLQERFLFHPEKLSAAYVYHFPQDSANDVPFEELNIPFNDSDTLNMVKFFPNDSVRRGVVVYFQGNRENIERYAKFASNFTKHGYEVWMEDYPGFGKTRGERTEQKMNEQALQVQKMAASKYGIDSIILYGKSLGTGIASYVAANSVNQRLILETPYFSIPSLFSCYAPIYPTQQMSTYKIPTNEYLADVRYPITIFHGTDDGVIPYRNAARLKKIIKPTDEFITIEKGTHHNLNDFDLFKQKLDSLLELR
ncbi:MAG: alpha/beta fold hydrolase [Chitinophagaceae bacterium]|nr:alpha/beta fold hydrolase [Chitinophagaceae bacterium]